MQPPKPAPVSRAPRTPGTRLGDLDERVELGAAHLVEVAQRGVARRESAGRPREVAGVERVDRLEDPRVLLDDVARPPRRHRIEARGRGVEHRRRDVAQRRDAGLDRGRSRRRPPRTRRGARCTRSARAAAATRCRMTTSATSSSGSGTARYSSDRQSSRSAAPASPHAEANWSISPHCDADVLVLAALGDPGQRHPVGRRAPRRPSSASADASSSAAERRQPGALRQVRGEDAAEPAHRQAGLGHRPRRRRDVVDPAARRAARSRRDRTGRVSPVVVERQRTRRSSVGRSAIEIPRSIATGSTKPSL